MLRNTENSWGTVAKAFHCLRSTLIIGQLKEWWPGAEWTRFARPSGALRASVAAARLG